MSELAIRSVFLLLFFFSQTYFSFATYQDTPTTALQKADQYAGIGKKLLKDAHYDSSLYYLDQAVIVYEKNFLWGKYLDIQNLISESHYLSGNYDKSITVLEAALAKALANISEKNHSVVKCYNSLGASYVEKGAYDKAIDFIEKALTIQLEILGEDHEGTGMIYNDLGFAYASKGDYDKAIYYYHKSIKIRQERLGPDHFLLAVTYNNLGSSYGMKGYYDRELLYYEKSLSIKLKELGALHPEVALCYNNMGYCYFIMEDYDNALLHFQKTLKIRLATLAPDHPLVAATYSNIGACYKEKNDFKKAISNLEKSLEIRAEKLGKNHPKIAFTYKHLADVYGARGNYDEQLSNYKKALYIRLNAYGEEHPDVIEIYHKMGLCYENIGKEEAFFHYLQRALAIQIKIFGPKHPATAEICNDLGRYYLAVNDLQKATVCLQQSLVALVETFNDDNIYGVPELKQVSSHTILLKTLRLRAQLFTALHQKSNRLIDLEHALKSYELAVQLTDSIRFEFSLSSSKQNLLNKVFPIYEEAIQVGYKLFSFTEDEDYIYRAFYMAEKSKSTLLLDAVKESSAKYYAHISDSLLMREKNLKIDLAYCKKNLFEAKQKKDSSKIVFYRNQLFDLKRAHETLVKRFELEYPSYFQLKYNMQPAGIASIQYALEDDEALVEYFMGDRDIFIFSILKNNFFIHKLSKAETVSHAIIELRKALTSGNLDVENTRLYIEKAHLLYNDLLKEHNDYFVHQNIQKLTIVPDGKIGYVPFELLLTKQTDLTIVNLQELPYLIKDYQTGYAYSATLHFAVPMIQNNAKESDFLGFAPSYSAQLVSAPVQEGLSELIWNKEEVATISDFFKGTYFTDEQATEKTFKEHAKNYKILHLAMHALVNDEDPLFSKLAFFQNAATDDGLLHTYELYNMNLDADIVVLSACNTGYGKLIRGEGIMSLARAFTYAGCPSIVMSHWQVDDKSTAKLMVSFYAYLSEGLSKREALHKAKLDFLEDHKYRAHPFYWSGFVLIGNTDPIDKMKSQNGMLLWLIIPSSLLLFALLIYYFIIRKRAKKKINI